MKMFRCWKTFLWTTSLALSSVAAQGQDLRFAALQDVKCQELDADDIAAAEPKIVNFSAETQAYVVCMAQNALPSIQVVVAGLVPRFGTESQLGLDAFQRLKNVQDSQDLFVNSAFGEHRVAEFSDEILPLSAASADALLGPVKSRYVTKQVCKTEYQTKKECTTQPKEVCQMVYGRLECYTKYVEVCKDVTIPVEICENKPTLEYYRELTSLTGQWKKKPAGYCAKGNIEKRTRVVYGQTIEEQRCCETKVVYGQTQKVCGPWEAL
ncbi:MAG TPA: hypothetical protein VE954_14295 [Oligoflexus sp.]|uniref:hypothetical protein n=1 Tax=Oligoflexus sp. TaxID=1971216 RepID=UPI002D3BDFF4|nr:hypothetical protein [Oligoflexus sp.]HYX34269.1 hypothetical protein [Oligoflexus sp.]